MLALSGKIANLYNHTPGVCKPVIFRYNIIKQLCLTDALSLLLARSTTSLIEV